MEFTDFSSFLQLLFRWIHFVAGVAFEEQVGERRPPPEREGLLP